MATTNESVEQLNSFLRGEISAVETYKQAIDKLKTSSNASMLEQWKRSHEMRVSLLRDEITKLGGKPVSGSGPWGNFTKLIQAGADVLGEKAAVAALEEGEDHGLRDYRSDVAKLEGEAKSFVLQKIMPEQQKTHDGVSQLKKKLG
jgi:uncharacterized protein (TIGR02284 family)